MFWGVMIELRHLYHFDAVAESGSLHGAARQLGLRQPALSQSIRVLEAEIGVQLIERSASGARLTKAGAAFLMEIRQIFLALNRAVYTARLSALEDTAPLRLGIASSIASNRLVEILPKTCCASPHCKPIVSDIDESDCFLLLENGLFDLVMVPGAAVAGWSNMEILWEEDVFLALPATHPLAGENTVEVSQIDKMFLIAGSGKQLYMQDRLLIDACRDAGFQANVISSVRSIEVRLLMVAAGLGVTSVTSYSSDFCEARNIVVCALRPPVCMPVAAAWPKTGLMDAARRFLDVARCIE